MDKLQTQKVERVNGNTYSKFPMLSNDDYIKNGANFTQHDMDNGKASQTSKNG